MARITETIAFHFDNVEQQKRFHDRLNGKEPADREQLLRLADFMAEDVMAMTDDELAAEIAEDAAKNNT